MRGVRRVFSRTVTQVGHTARTLQKSPQKPPTSIVVSKDTEGLLHHKVTFPEGVIYTDVPRPTGEGSTPDPHVYFDAALVDCKALTATLYARQRKHPLDSIGVAVEHDGTQERQGRYRPYTVLTLHGNLTDEQRAGLLRVTGKCPAHKLMTEVEISIDIELAEYA